MPGEIQARFDELVRRAGLGGVPPAVLGVGVAVLAVAVCLGVWRWWPEGGVSSASGGTGAAVLTDGGTASATVSAGSRSIAATAPEAPDAARIWVHVVGAVRHPGLYQLGADSRVNDAIEAAGGFLGNAAPEGVNLARKIGDGEQLVVPTADEFAKSGASGAAGAGGASSSAGSGGQATSGSPVDINNATAEQLDTLPGVGPATATKIVADREANGPFKSVEDLGRVAGIGPKKLDDLKALIVVR